MAFPGKLITINSCLCLFGHRALFGLYANMFCMSLVSKSRAKLSSYLSEFMQSKRRGSSSLVDCFLSDRAWAAGEHGGHFLGLGINRLFVEQDLRQKYDSVK